MHRLTPTLQAAADPTRRRILRMLAASPRPAGDMVEAFSISQPAVSRHLRVLREAGLVSHEKRGRQRIYRLHPEPLREVFEWVSFYQDFWDDRLESLEQWLDNDAG